MNKKFIEVVFENNNFWLDLENIIALYDIGNNIDLLENYKTKVLNNKLYYHLNDILELGYRLTKKNAISLLSWANNMLKKSINKDEKAYNYRIYLGDYHNGYDYIATVLDETDIKNYYWPNEKYTKLLVIRHDIYQDIDEPYLLEFFDNRLSRKRKKF